MLDSVSSGKRLPEKSLLVLGGTPQTQKDFLDSLPADPDNKRRQPDRGPKKPPVANQFALGYTYQNVLDADHEDTLARLGIHMLSNPEPSFTPLLKPLLTPKMLPNTLLVILLDWSQPWLWVRQVRDWVRVLRSLMLSLDDECKDRLEENVNSWRKRGKSSSSEGSTTTADAEVTIPLGPGEGDEHLGLPLLVVAQNADRIEALEREHGWREEQFDFILQYLRTILLKHGASLLYTMPGAAGSLQTLVHTSLGIQSTLERRQDVKANYIDREGICIPWNWDSWGKIRVLTEGFDLESVSALWSDDIQTPPESKSEHDPVDKEQAEAGTADGQERDTAVSIYESTVLNPQQPSQTPGYAVDRANGFEVETMDNQAFLTEQLKVLEQLRAEDDQSKAKQEPRRGTGITSFTPRDTGGASGVIEEHIGPVQYNMGGIRVDAGDMVRSLQVSFPPKHRDVWVVVDHGIGARTGPHRRKRR